MDNDSVISYLKERNPEAFEGWDEHQVSITATQQKGMAGTLLVMLSNKSDDKNIRAGVELHRMISVDLETETVSVGEVGSNVPCLKIEKLLYPKVFKREG